MTYAIFLSCNVGDRGSLTTAPWDPFAGLPLPFFVNRTRRLTAVRVPYNGGSAAAPATIIWLSRLALTHTAIIDLIDISHSSILLDPAKPFIPARLAAWASRGCGKSDTAPVTKNVAIVASVDRVPCLGVPTTIT